LFSWLFVFAFVFFFVFKTILFLKGYTLYRTFFRKLPFFTLLFVMQIYKQKIDLCNTKYYHFDNFFDLLFYVIDN